MSVLLGKFKKKIILLLLFVEPSVGITVVGIQEEEKNFKTQGTNP